MGAKRITIGEIKRLRECKEKDRLTDLGLDTEFRRRKQAIGMVLSNMVRHLQKGDKEEIFLNEMKSSLSTTLPYSEPEELEKEIALISRLSHFLYQQKMEIVSAETCYFIDMPHTSYGGKYFDAIAGRVQMIVKRSDGKYEAMCFIQKEPEYSHRARKISNLPENALELLCMKLGLERKYPGIICSLYYLKNKDDKGSNLMEYEHKPEKNIISISFEGWTQKKLLEQLQKAVTIPVEANCDSCPVKEVCLFPKQVRTGENPEEMKMEGESVKKSEPTDSQTEVIHHVDGPMNVIAIPGSGKTFSLVQRMKYLIEEKNISPAKILFVTYTDKACREIQSRVQKELGTEDETKLPSIMTINALGYKILRDNPSLVGRRVKLAGRTDRKAKIRDALKLVPHIQGVSYSGKYLEHGLIANLENEFEKIESVGEEMWKKSFKGKDPEGVLRVYQTYQEMIDREGYISYDEQITLCNKLLEDERLSLLYSKVYRYIMVDEFQDVNDENVKLIYTIAKHHGNIVVVGDDDQSIYGFRGGSNHYILHFKESYGDAKTVYLSDNFRSNDKILEAADSLIKENGERYEKEMMAHQKVNYLPVFYKDFSLPQLQALVEKILNEGYYPGDVAILGRYNKTLFQIGNMLERASIPFTAPKDYLIQDAVFIGIKDALSLCYESVVKDEALYRILWYLGVRNIKKADTEKSLFDDLTEQYHLPAGEDTNATAFYQEKEKQEEKSVENAFAKLFFMKKNIQYANSLEEILKCITKTLFHIEEHRVCDVLLSLAEERAIVTGKSLRGLMEDMYLFKDETRVGYEGGKENVNLLTAHDAKGKEFPVVIVYAAEEFSDEEEERRLLYVAMTRAKKALFVTESPYQNASLMKACSQKMICTSMS